MIRFRSALAVALTWCGFALEIAGWGLELLAAAIEPKGIRDKGETNRGGLMKR